MASIEEKRVHAGGTDDAVLLVACGSGLVRVRVAGDRVGGFEVVTDRTAVDVAAGHDRVAVATPEGVLAGPAETALEPALSGGATAVAVTPDGWVAGDDDGRLVRLVDGERRSVDRVGAVRALDPPLVAAADGVHRLEADTATAVGLTDGRDVAAAPVPRAATETGLHRLGNGWLVEREGPATALAGGRGDRAVAVVDGTPVVRTEAGWTERPAPVPEPVVDVALGPATYAVTDAGTVLVDAGDGWRSRALGVPAVGAVTARARSG